MVILYLTCANEDEAKNISLRLLNDKLIACSRISAVKSLYWWDGKINNDNETLLMMETKEGLYDKIVKILNDVHSYKEYVLTVVPVTKTTPGVHKWLDETLSKDV